jgi:spermidine synthase
MFFEFDTKFGHYSVADTNYHGRAARVLYSGHYDAAQSGVAQDGKTDLLFDYNQRFLELLEGLRPDSVLVLGGGAFTLPTALLHEFPELRLDVVELDGELVAIAKEYFDFQPTSRTDVHVGDARKFIGQTHRKYDAVIVDVFSHATVPSSFQTSEAVQCLRNCLTKDGVAAINLISSLDGRNGTLLRRMHELAQAEFPNVQVFPATYGLSSWTAQNYVLTAQLQTRDLAPFMRYGPLALP